MKPPIRHKAMSLLCITVALALLSSGSLYWPIVWAVLGVLYAHPEPFVLPALTIPRDQALAAACLIVAASYYALMVLR